MDDPMPRHGLPPELEDEARRYAGTGRLLVSISHDLNNLLQPLVGYLELLGDRVEPDGEEAEMVFAMRRTTEIAAVLVERLLELGRTGGPTPLHIAPDRLLEWLDPLVRRMAGPRVRLDVVLSAPGARLSLPVGALEQIVLNLVGNARDAMPEGGTLKLHSRHAADAWTLDVEDSGTGVEAGDTARLFESGFTTKRRRGGAGLGLWIVRTLVEGAGGRVEIGASPLRGTRVTIRIPLAPPA